MAENDFLPFAAAADSNVLDQATYAAASATATGFVSGVASSAAVNKTLRQSSIMAAVLASFIQQQTGADVIDDGTLATILANLTASVTGRLIGVQMFTTSGTYTPTPGTKNVVVEVQGAGGAGGGTPACDSTHAALGGGGGSGAYAKSRLTSGFSGATVTVGAGGTGVSNANGNAGGTSSFGSISAPGGGGGIASPNVYNSLAIAGYGAGGAVATGGNLVNAKGTCSIQGFISSPAALGRSGSGAPSNFGGGAEPIISASSAGNAATTYGSGGSGSLTLTSGPAAAGGAGANGVVIVWEYA